MSMYVCILKFIFYSTTFIFKNVTMTHGDGPAAIYLGEKYPMLDRVWA